ncbi:MULTISPECIES: endonuclease/exonuclease/phosphatase family protein [Halocynthiibacter]|uniref:Endonuclease/exonuclease/phosphatase family protein n=1 Tax=Halocynthiibacter halioticoli TaxID=2986804 RepID=A0AAE3IXY3_9RHOB|nr:MULTISPECIES: endonuclease/exonuclease/phosphatase family protein [Halocynthiibacter]MCV6823789.1 endonuclease/exonuclease/phosphatase family protein [Halocynthiibacter halioticoli]MCW4056790.1 endonuclease/exonuclease/phosphatase family protein [Halocynthiibacter sp. SDUM655004]
MRLATYNVEWFNFLFDKQNKPLFDDAPSKRYQTSRGEQLAAIGAVFQALDADAVLIIEAPDTAKTRSTVTALEAFAADNNLRANRAVVGFRNETQQQIALLYDPTILSAVHDPQGSAADVPSFDGLYHIDLDVDGAGDAVRFSKPPLEIALETSEGRKLRLIGVHAKSKAPYGAKNKDEETRISIENRRKQLAQCIWVRQRVEGHLAKGEDVVVLGDFNDGPGLDEYERLFGRSGVEIVLGEEGEDCLYDPHARMGQTRRFGGLPTTSRFYISREKRFLGALLDYIMVSEKLRPLARNWRIWHPFEDPQIYKTPLLREALLTASDHFPVTLDIDI